ncbi:MAG: hypothetical protein WCX17_02555 [Parcubacteria group bacterium]|jgi:hypothetical protein
MKTGIESLDKKIDFGMFMKAMMGRFKSILAGVLDPEEKLEQIIQVLEREVQGKRVLAREIGGQMRAIADPDTKELEPLEALKARRAKLVKLGGTMIDDVAKATQLGQIQQEIKSIDALVASQQATYDTLAESYTLAKGNYQEAFSALETVRRNGPAMLKAIQAHKDALAQRDKARDEESIDTSFLADLTAELSKTKAELRSDTEIERDLDASDTHVIDRALAEMDKATVDEGLMAEFRAATGK